MIACSSTSASEWPNRPVWCGIVTPPTISLRPSTRRVAVVAGADAERRGRVVGCQCHGSFTVKSGLRRGQVHLGDADVGRQRHFQVAGVAFDQLGRQAQRFDRAGVVGDRAADRWRPRAPRAAACSGTSAASAPATGRRATRCCTAPPPLRLTVSTTGSASRPPTGSSPTVVISFSISAASRPGRAASCTSTQSSSRIVSASAAGRCGPIPCGWRRRSAARSRRASGATASMWPSSALTTTKVWRSVRSTGRRRWCGAASACRRSAGIAWARSRPCARRRRRPGSGRSNVVLAGSCVILLSLCRSDKRLYLTFANFAQARIFLRRVDRGLQALDFRHLALDEGIQPLSISRCSSAAAWPAGAYSGLPSKRCASASRTDASRLAAGGRGKRRDGAFRAPGFRGRRRCRARIRGRRRPRSACRYSVTSMLRRHAFVAAGGVAQHRAFDADATRATRCGSGPAHSCAGAAVALHARSGAWKE